MSVCSCIYCRKEFSTKGIFVHVDRAHLNICKYSTGHNGKYDIISKGHDDKRKLAILEYSKSPSYCLECDTALSYDNKDNKFCSHSCSARHHNIGRVVSQDQKNKLREAINLRLAEKGYKAKVEVTKCCEFCKKDFVTKIDKKRFCSRSCSAKSRSNLDKNVLEDYRRLCAFKFNLRDFGDEFDFSLIEEHGWYKPKNKGDNLYGVSRDHKVSVRYGFDNNIDPLIISHPANCQLKLHSHNVSKGIKNSISIEQLLLDIVKFDEKYQIKV